MTQNAQPGLFSNTAQTMVMTLPPADPFFKVMGQISKSKIGSDINGCGDICCHEQQQFLLLLHFLFHIIIA